MKSYTNSFEVILNPSRGIGGYEGITSAADVDVWTAISLAYSKVVLSGFKSEKVEIRIDWSPAISYAIKIKDFNSKSIKEQDIIYKSNPDFFQRGIICPVVITISKSNSEPFAHCGYDYLMHTLYEIYLIGNLAVPGSVNLYRSYIKVPSLDLTDPFAITELELSEYMFENAWHDSQENSQLKVSFIPFDEVFNWYQKFNLGLRQVANTNTEKAIFTLLHLGRRSFLEPEATLWLASALEAVYDTPIGSAFQFLHNRIASLFSLNPKQHADMKKRLRRFYDIRNGFSHGGSDICHPIANETWDSTIDKIYNQNIELNDFSAAILIGTIQELIRRNIAEFKFNEVISEVSF